MRHISTLFTAALLALCLGLVVPALSTAVQAQTPTEESPGESAGAPAGEETTETPAEPAADENEAAEESSGESIFTVIYKGGWTMVGLALISTIIVAFGLERWFYFRKQRIETKGYFERLQSTLESGGLDALEKEIQSDDLLLSRILMSGLRAREKGLARVEKEIESAATVEIGKLERGLNLLANLGNLAPLLGFFGTVVGMRSSFLQFVQKAAPTAQDLAGGVEEALITTAAGLLVAIPTYLVYNLFIYYIDNFTMEVERSASAISGELQ